MSMPLLAPILLRGSVVMARHPIDSVIRLYNWKYASSISLGFLSEVRA